MSETNSVRARARRDEDMWVIEIEGYGVTQAERLTEIDYMVRDYVSCMDDIDPSLVSVSTVIELPAEVQEAQSARKAAVEANSAASSKARVAVRALKARGWQNREIAAALGVTPGRVSQLSGVTPKGNIRSGKGDPAQSHRSARA